MKNTKSEAVYCERIRAALRNRGILGAEHGPNVNPRPFGECEKLLKEMYPAVFEEIKTAYLPKKLTCSPAVKAVRPVAGELDTFEICYDEWRACGHGDKWNVRDKAGALLLETQDGYADYKLPSQDAERIARLAASAPGLLAALDAIVNPNPDYRSEEHTSELQSRQYLPSSPTRRSANLLQAAKPRRGTHCEVSCQRAGLASRA